MSKTNNLQNLIQQIYQTHPDELRYRDAEPQMIQALDANLSLAELEAVYPALWHYLQQDPDAYDEYEAIWQMNQVQDVPIPDLDTLPPRPDQNWWQLVQTMIQRPFTGFALPQLTTQHRRLDQSYPKTAEIPLNDNITLDCIINLNETNSLMRDLLCALEIEHDQPFSAEVVLISTTNMYRQPFDELGDAVFDNLPPNTYQIYIQLNNQRYHIADVTIV